MPLKSSYDAQRDKGPDRPGWLDHRDDDRIKIKHEQELDNTQSASVGSMECIIDRILTIPQEKPDLERVLRVVVQADIRDWELVHTERGSKIIAFGRLSVGLEYVANLSEQSMHYVHFTVPYHGFIVSPRRVKGVISHVEHVRHGIINPRSISLTVLLYMDTE